METYLRTLPANAPKPSGATAKCDWVEFLVEYGVCGLLLMLGIVGIHARWWIQWRGWKNVLSSFLLWGSLGVLFHACFDSILRNPALLLLFSGMQIAAVRLAAPAKGRKSKRRSRDGERPSRVETSTAEDYEGDPDGETADDDGGGGR